MSLPMKLFAAYVKRTRHSTWASADRVREIMSRPRHSAAIPHELYQVNHVTGHEVTTGDGTFTVHSLVPATDAPRDTPLDICVYLHGGGYVNGLDDRHWKFVSDIAGAGMKVIVPDYGLAPEHTASSARTLLDRVIGDAADEARDSGHRLCLAGDSAGGGLALGWMLTTGRHDARDPVERIALVSPWLDVSCTTEGLDALVDDDPWLHPDGLRVAGLAWAGADTARGVDIHDPLVSPLAAPDTDLAALPPTAVWTGTRDILHADALALGARMHRTGATVDVHTCDGAVHVHPLTPTPEGKAAREEVIRWLSS
ncbi:MAG: alpha/beta hydrolase [Corynebacterium provencense]|jgi:acetyl esterase/lipase|uniref:alpha/beta hydrolase fold domain-containing protein n=1 Tax=Corynebacterium provencense TaxID=1737425 RepID=UPI002989C9DB|nr:alpha/beta hydrolase [Corynebacterium provencense]